MSRKIKINAVVDASSGEVLSKSEQVQNVRYFDDEKGYLFKLNQESIKTFPGCGLPEDLTESETARLYRLSLTMHKGSNLLCYRSGNLTKPMNTSRIAGYLRLTVRRTLLFLQHMIQRRIIGRVKVKIGNTQETQYYLNPLYFFCGKWLSVNLYFLFRRDLDKVLPAWVIERFASYDNLNQREKRTPVQRGQKSQDITIEPPSENAPTGILERRFLDTHRPAS